MRTFKILTGITVAYTGLTSKGRSAAITMGAAEQVDARPQARRRRQHRHDNADGGTGVGETILPILVAGNVRLGIAGVRRGTPVRFAGRGFS